jgi:hypothetical protein
MPRRAGTADLPLHGGHVPKWPADRMTRLGAVITQAPRSGSARPTMAAAASAAGNAMCAGPPA